MMNFKTLLQRYFSGDSKIPVLIVGNKAGTWQLLKKVWCFEFQIEFWILFSDMTAVRQDYILQPDAFCKKHRVNLV